MSGRTLRLTPRGVGLVLAAIAILALTSVLSLPALRSPAALLLAVVVLGVVVVSVMTPKVRVDCVVQPDRVAHGDRAAVRVIVTNESMFPTLAGRWRYPGPRAMMRQTRGVWPGLRPRDAAGSQAILDQEFRANRRGEHELGPFTVWTTDPLGVAVRRVTAGTVARVVVLPQVIDLTEQVTGFAPGARAGAHGHSSGFGDDDVIARAHVPGDPLKRMHWKATAHRGTFMVRQEDREHRRRMGVVLDTRRTAFSDRADDFEWAISMVASVVYSATKLGYGVEAVVGDCAVGTVGEGADLSIAELMEDLAFVRADGADGDGPSPLSSTTVIVVLGVTEADDAKRWIDCVPADSSVVSFVHDDSPAEVGPLLTAAGWHVFGYRAGDDVGAAWAGVSRDARAAH